MSRPLLKWASRKQARSRRRCTAGNHRTAVGAALVFLDGRGHELAYGIYTDDMSDVGERLREESRERLRRMTPAERLAEALELGERAIDAYAAAHGIDRAAARHRLESSGQAGRRLSRVMRGIVE